MLKCQTPHDMNRESGVVEPLVDGGGLSARQSWVKISHQDHLKTASQYFPTQLFPHIDQIV